MKSNLAVFVYCKALAPGGPHAALCATLIWKPEVLLDPFHPTQIPLMNNKQPVKLQLLCAGIYARLQLIETPSAQQIIGPNHCCSWGFNTCHMRLYIRKSPVFITAGFVYFTVL